MAHDVTFPALGESVTEGTVTRLLKKVGDEIAVDEPLLEISTDKVDTEIPSPFAGTVLEILVAEEQVVSVGAVLARIGESADAGTPPTVVESVSTAAPEPIVMPEPEVAVVPAPEPAYVPARMIASDRIIVPEPAVVTEPTPAPVAVPAPAPVAGPAPVATPAPVAPGLRDVVLPALGESVTEGTVTRWLKHVGDPVALDEPLLEISTDKVDTEIPSPFAGTLTEILVEADQAAAVGAVLGRIATSFSAPTPAGAASRLEELRSMFRPAPTAAPTPTPTLAPVTVPALAPIPTLEPTPAPAPIATPVPSSVPAVIAEGTYLTPLVRKLAADRGVALASIVGTGIGGRVTKEDVLAATPAPAPVVTPGETPSGGVEASALRGTTVKMTRLRGIVAERMMESLHGMAQLTTVVEVDVSRVWALRARVKDAFRLREGAKLTFLPFFTKAVAEALLTHFTLNASIDGENIVYHGVVNLGIAIDTDKGLIVPAIKDADKKSLADHARAIADLGERARANHLTPDDLAGGTFTVTNTGSVGALFDTPIVPAPQVAILGTGVITKRPVAIEGPDGEEVIAIRPMCFLSISYDHRLVDGADASRFLAAVKARIEAGVFESEVGP